MAVRRQPPADDDLRLRLRPFGGRQGRRQGWRRRLGLLRRPGRRERRRLRERPRKEALRRRRGLGRELGQLLGQVGLKAAREAAGGIGFLPNLWPRGTSHGQRTTKINDFDRVREGRRICESGGAARKKIAVENPRGCEVAGTAQTLLEFSSDVYMESRESLTCFALAPNPTCFCQNTSD